MRKILIVALSILFLFSFAMLMAQDDISAKDPDDIRDYTAVEKAGLTPQKVLVVDGQAVPQNVRTGLTLREKRKLIQITRARIEAQQKATVTARPVQKDLSARPSNF